MSERSSITWNHHGFVRVNAPLPYSLIARILLFSDSFDKPCEQGHRAKT
jgi:hypothetical protein